MQPEPAPIPRPLRLLLSLMIGAPMLAPGLALGFIAWQLRSVPVLSIGLAAAAALYIAALARYAVRSARAMDRSKPMAQRQAEEAEAFTDVVLARVGLTLILAVVAMVAIIVWGLSQPR